MTASETIMIALRTLFEPGDVFEVRVLDAALPGSKWTHTESGFFSYDQIDIDPVRPAGIIRRRWAEFVHGEGCDWQKLTKALG